MFFVFGVHAQTKAIRLIVRGDDMGFSHAGNLGIIKAYKEGIEKSIEVIVPSPWFPEAVRLLEEAITYRQLEEQSNQLAHALIEAGGRRGDRVGIYLKKSPAAIVSIFGIRKTGACQVPDGGKQAGPRRRQSGRPGRHRVERRGGLGRRLTGQGRSRGVCRRPRSPGPARGRWRYRRLDSFRASAGCGGTPEARCPPVPARCRKTS